MIGKGAAMDGSAAAMDGLKREVHALARVIPAGAAITYLDYPVTNNIGDVLIMLGADEFFRANRNRIAVCGTADNGLRRLRATPSGQLIVLHGGGNLGDLYPGHERFRRAVIAARPDCPIVILPQTIHFRDPAELRASADVYRAHPDLVLCVRDQASERIAREHLAERVVLAPDMAHTLWPVPCAEPGSGDLLLLRTDAEASADAGAGIDWNAVLSAPTKAGIHAMNALHRLDGRIPTGLPLYRMYRRLARRVMAEAVAFFSPYARVTTSRLHAHILACLMAKPVLLHDNSYGKNRSYFEAWTSRLGQVTLTARSPG